MIPALICPCISRFDFLERMLASIDTEVGQTIIVDNSCTGYVAPAKFDHLNLRYIRPIDGLGYGGGINEGIRQTPELPWWFFTNNDIVFRPGMLAECADWMDARPQPVMLTWGFSWGALNQATVAKVGLFDDWTFFPIYYDDNDFYRRCELGGVLYAENDHVNVYPDGVSHTIRSERRFDEANHRSFGVNRANYIAKWGGMPGEEKFTSPWNEGWPLWYTKPDLRARAERKW